MIIDLARRASNVDPSLSIIVNADDTMYTLSVYAEGMGELYMYSSTDLAETYTKVGKFIDALTNPEDLNKILLAVSEESFGE